MKRANVPGDAIGTFPESDLTQGVDHDCRIEPVRAARRACLTGQTQPDGLGSEQTIPEIELQETDDLVGFESHLGRHGAAGRALAALIAACRVEAGRISHLREQGGRANGRSTDLGR